MISIDKYNIAPYLSILVGVKLERSDSNAIHDLVVGLIKGEPNLNSNIEFLPTKSDLIGVVGEVYYSSYQIIKAPSWFKGEGVNDIENHVIVTIAVGDYLAFYFSEKGRKDEIRTYFGSANLKDVSAIEINRLNYHFINEDKIKVLWLLGIHGKNSFKADSKVLGGDSVADTLDPLSDQSYMMSAVRTGIGDSNSTIGLNPFKSSIWQGPCRNWETFENRVVEILDTLRSQINYTDNNINILASPVSDTTGLEGAYDFSLVDYELYPEDGGQVKKDLLKSLQYNYYAEVNVSVASKNISLTIYYNGDKIGELKVQPKIIDYMVSYKIIYEKEESKKKSLLDKYSKVFKHPELIRCWFESGHALINGMLFKTDYQDVSYNDFMWADFEGYNIKKEKPELGGNLALEDIGNQDSLFCWVKNRWNGAWIDRSKFNTTERTSGWLYCDDGAGEKADFIHVIEYENSIIISLIHVKAANSNSPSRRISVGAHDIVLNQAIKNLRYCKRKNLHTDLQDRLENSKGKVCWLDNIQKNPEEFISYLSSINKTSNLKLRVVVVQPHT
ncbi:hypothetical protein DVQ54_23015, partial [Yersinia enterocolitica]|nr:hypothetical protein [Yersinia enterocolitica]